MKLKHQRAFSAVFGLTTAPVLEFHPITLRQDQPRTRFCRRYIGLRNGSVRIEIHAEIIRVGGLIEIRFHRADVAGIYGAR